MTRTAEQREPHEPIVKGEIEQRGVDWTKALKGKSLRPNEIPTWSVSPVGLVLGDTALVGNEAQVVIDSNTANTQTYYLRCTAWTADNLKMIIERPINVVAR